MIFARAIRLDSKCRLTTCVVCVASRANAGAYKALVVKPAASASTLSTATSNASASAVDTARATTTTASAAATTDGDSGGLRLQFRAFHTKDTKKKHKNYADGVLVVRGHTATLYAMDGAVLTKTSSYTTKTLASLTTGNDLRLGALLVEIGEPLTESEYASGAVFLNESTNAAGAAMGSLGSVVAAPTQQPLVVTKFKSHQTAFAVEVAAAARQPLSARHDPDAPNAVVLSRPAPSDAHTHCAVVVDPFVGSRLRPHQVAGVKFLYTAVANGTGCILADEMGAARLPISAVFFYKTNKSLTKTI